MFDALNEKLAAAREQGRQQRIWKQRLLALEEELVERENQAIQWERQLNKEESDVERLKGMSFSRFFLTIRQKKETQLELEMLGAKLKYEEVNHEITNIKAEIEALKTKLSVVQDWDLEEKNALGNREKLLQNGDPGVVRQLHELAERKAGLKILLKELAEALQEGHIVTTKLDLAKNAFLSSIHWDSLDSSIDETAVTPGKHDELDEAIAHIHNAQQSLVRFDKEMRDVRASLTMEMDASPFLRFSDNFFDGLITDWILQGKVQSTIAQIDAKSSAIKTVLWELENEQSKTENELAVAIKAYTSLSQSI
ncbi:hypothetical protein [Paenibacillus eucommiae]|uniref:CopG family antitoxin n=1 Tax=Paenibacillus eucommiae TaxID=1355755 RepID=A0ABS4J697_9BACL|nr:hypothetical protein [Paenibacillus eucommiae]MBP1995308.1 putative CopG family antitoxin [Paenibacillus eucommiae]